MSRGSAGVCAAVLCWMVAVLQLQMGLAVPVAPTTTQASTPALDDSAAYARYIACKTDWGALSSLKSEDLVASRVYSYVSSVSGGEPFFYVTKYDKIISNLLKKGSKATFVASMAQTSFCKDNNYDPADPRCPQLILTGALEEVKENGKDLEAAKNAIFSKHPEMKDWPQDHGWVVVKMNVDSVEVINGLMEKGKGHSRFPTPEQYHSATVNGCTDQ